MEMMYYELARSSYQDSLKVLEADIQHANALWVFSFCFLSVFFYMGLFCFCFPEVSFFFF